MSDILYKKVQDLNINIDGMINAKDRCTIVKTRVIAHNQQVVRVDREKIEEISDAHIDQLIDNVDKLLPNIDIIIISNQLTLFFVAKCSIHFFLFFFFRSFLSWGI